VVDVDTRAAISTARVLWMYELPGSGGGSLEEAELDRTSGNYVFLAPEGTVRARAESDGYASAGNRPFDDLGPSTRMTPKSPTRFEVRLRRAGNLVVRLGRNGVPIEGPDLDDEYTLLVGWTIDGLSGNTSSDPEDGQARVENLLPGTWTVKLVRVAPWTIVDEKEIEVRAGETAEVVVDVEGKR
jgi:hypothetical protein